MLWTLVMVAAAASHGCAEGLPGPNAASELLPGSTPPLPAADAGTTPPAAAPTPPAFAGEMCVMGETQQCVCEAGALGTRACVANAASPTGGELGPCENCVAPDLPMPDAGTGAAGTPATPPTTTPPAAPACQVSDCPEPSSPIPLLPAPEACCTASGSCGEMGLLGCM